ncbi:FAD/NAD-P-binding domain-containing protein [Auriscalpium vulgare]|uniref:FAD/NAD-P-binding domain-containing protein n=1 Tax=Auriscalpium vulgare TaxID=40419 RepID=A0ACB8S6T9_9AGAM|nr:FAD/NAD-P-binding domain-containing protein [Auriscalpium vulgare]
MKSDSVGVAVIGAGFGGLGVGIALKRQWGYEDFVIFEKASEIGGTWRDNTYPGCGSDVPIHWYSYSTDLKSDWKRSHGSQAEIQQYLLDVTEKYALRAHCLFDTAVVSANWDSSISLWQIVTENFKTGKKTTTTAKILISAVGPLSEPHISSIAGADDFKGETFHSAQWRHDVVLHGKRVAVIGNGCSATQLVPVISEDPAVNVVNFCRTPMWLVPGDIPAYSELSKWIFTHIPFAMRLHRNKIMFQYDIRFLLFRGKTNFLTRGLAKSQTKYIKQRAPKEYHDKIIPTYPPGCKRLVRDTNYLASLHRPNVSQNWDGIAAVTENGLRLKTGEKVPFDVIIYATGFVTEKFPVTIKNTHSETVNEYWERHGGPAAYLGTTLPTFPNFIIIEGPNTATGHASVVFTEETQINYALQLMKPVLSGDLASFEPTAAASDAYNSHLQRRLDASVWTQCASWYRVGAQGRIFSVFPGPVALFWWWLRAPRWGDYTLTGKGKAAWERRRKVKSVLWWLGVLGLVGAGLHGVGLRRAGMSLPGEGVCAEAVRRVGGFVGSASSSLSLRV